MYPTIKQAHLRRRLRNDAPISCPSTTIGRYKIVAGAIAIGLSVINTWYAAVVISLHQPESRSLESRRADSSREMHVGSPFPKQSPIQALIPFDASHGNIHWFSTTAPSLAPTMSPTPFITENHAATIPHEVLKQYRVWHSMNVVRNESHDELSQRRYAIAFFSCPYQVGNRWHHFLNAFLWSVVTNRTLLVHYWTADICRVQRHRQDQIVWHDPRVCQSANTMAECDDVLERADWIPTYTEWASLYGWSTNLTHVLSRARSPDNETTIPVLDYWSLHSYVKSPEWEQKRFPRRRISGGTNQTDALVDAPKVDEVPFLVVDFPELVGKERTLSLRIQRYHLLATQSARERAEALTALGMEFLYGLLWKSAFDFRLGTPGQGANDVHSMTDNAVHDNTYSIALHSRHRKGLNSTNLRKETECLAKLLGPFSNTTSRICLMSDRPDTLAALDAWIRATYPTCTVVIAANEWIKADSTNQTEQKRSFRNEHGPIAGISFIHELHTCQHYTDAFIGTGRGSSSTYLLEEWVEYNHIMKQRHRQTLKHASDAAASIDTVKATNRSVPTDDDVESDTLIPWDASFTITSDRDKNDEAREDDNTTEDQDDASDNDRNNEEVGIAKCWL